MKRLLRAEIERGAEQHRMCELRSLERRIVCNSPKPLEAFHVPACARGDVGGRTGGGDRALDRDRQAYERRFHHVVDRAALEGDRRAFFADRARDEDQRTIRVCLVDDSPRRESVEIGEAEIAEHDVGHEVTKRGPQLRFTLRCDPFDRHPETPERGDAEFAIGSVVVDDERPDRHRLDHDAHALGG
jgi:hypothetical protein